MRLPKRKPSRNWKVVWWAMRTPVKGPWKGRWLATRYQTGHRTPAEAWRIFNRIRATQHIPRVELWQGKRRHLTIDNIDLTW